MYEILAGWDIHSESENFLIIEHCGSPYVLTISNVEILYDWASRHGLEIVQIDRPLTGASQVLLRKVI